MKKVAFFDVDGTIFRSSLLVVLVEGLIAKGIFPEDAEAEFERMQNKWRDREGSYIAYIDAVINAFREHIKGVHYGEVVDVGREVLTTHNKRVYRYTRDLLIKLKDEGYYLVAVSHSPKLILDLFCSEYGFDKVYGNLYQIGPTDRFTGVVETESYMEDKSNIVERVFAKGDFDQSDSIAVGDTPGDISMFKVVSHPICFNPSRALYEVAKENGWKVVVERKDMIYEL